jgi:hypothetical protein
MDARYATDGSDIIATDAALNVILWVTAGSGALGVALGVLRGLIDRVPRRSANH